MNECISKLRRLTNKKCIFFVDRGNRAILLALKLAKQNGFKKIYVQDQGGWITYKQYAKKLKFELNEINTNYGLISSLDIAPGSVLLINSMPGYYALVDMQLILDFCIKNKVFLINDISGSIGTAQAKYGEIVFGSFGRWKPVNLEYGGFIGFDNKEYEKFFRDHFQLKLKNFYSELNHKLEILPQRLKILSKHVQKVKSDLKHYDIINRNNNGLNVIVKFRNDREKNTLVKYCKNNNYDYTLCPRYIRVLDKAISIEIKRLG